MDTRQYKELFISEAKEILTHLNKRLVDLEKQPQNKECLNEIFRQAHTLKGMAATMGYQEITKLTHEMESVLDLLRQGRLSADKSTVDLLFDSFDALEVLVDEVASDGGKGAGAKRIDVAVLAGKLEKVKTEYEKKSLSPEKEKRTNLRLDEVDRLEIIDKEKQGFKTYRLVVSLAKECELKAPRAFVIVKTLQDMGKVIRQEFLCKQLEKGKFGRHFGLFFITREKPDTIKEKVEGIADVEKVILRLLEVDEVLLASRQEIPSTQKTEFKEREEAVRGAQMIRVSLNKLDDLMDAVGELVINKIRLTSIAKELGHKPLAESLTQMSRLTDLLQAGIMDVRLVPMDYIFNRFPRLVRDVAAQEKKEVDFAVEGSDIGLDRTLLDEINEPLVHLLKNALGHGIELPEVRTKSGKQAHGKIKLSARRERAFVVIEVSDDGQGIDPQKIKKTAVEKGVISREEAEKLSDEEALMLITLPGVSTSEKVTETSGRGVGMNSVRTKIESFGGDLIIQSKVDEGSRFILKLPLSMAIIQALLVRLSHETYAIPLINITETIKINPEMIKTVEHHEVIPYRDEVLPLIRLDERFGFLSGNRSVEGPSEIRRGRIPVVVVEIGRRKAGLVVDALLTQQEVVIKTLNDPLKNMKGVAGATILGDGKVAMIVDVASIV